MPAEGRSGIAGMGEPFPFQSVTREHIFVAPAREKNDAYSFFISTTAATVLLIELSEGHRIRL